MSDVMDNVSRRRTHPRRRGILRALSRSESGNVLAITAAATIPMLGVIGGAIDISRIYLTKSRIQAACDSAVLAGRKAMTTVTYTPQAKARADSMFNFNFQEGDYGTSGTSFNSSADAEGMVSGTAQTTVPMVIMGMFGAGPSDLTVQCSADIQVPNIDIVLVLDVTGSMDSSIGGKKKINSLKEAAKDFYETIETALAGNTTSQVRYGFVPYSESVNGSDLFKVSPNTSKGELSLSHIADRMMVQSRVANFRTFDPDFVPNSPQISSEWEIYGGSISSSSCKAWVERQPTTSGSPPATVTHTTYAGSAQNSQYSASINHGWSGAPDTSGSDKSCRRWKSVSTIMYDTVPRYRFTDWTYKPVEYDVSQFKVGDSIRYVSSSTPSGKVATPGEYDLVTLANEGVTSTSTTSWDGCLEERDTVAQSNFAPIPAAAYDMNYINGGTSNVLRWRPIIRELTYGRGQQGNRTNTTTNYSKPAYSCPSATMRNLNVMTKSEFNQYIDSLQPNGNTYLDVGMIWGLRLIAPQGMFANRNLVGPNGGQISRHIIFLTDGEPVSANNRYTAYGVEQMERRITGSTGVAQATLHSRRFQALCGAQRGSVSIWAIAFGTSVTSHLSSCADPGRAFQANNTDQLKDAFRRIAREVADLRLVQ